MENMPHGPPPHGAPEFYYKGYIPPMHGGYPQNHQEFGMYNRNFNHPGMERNPHIMENQEMLHPQKMKQVMPQDNYNMTKNENSNPMNDPKQMNGYRSGAQGYPQYYPQGYENGRMGQPGQEIPHQYHTMPAGYNQNTYPRKGQEYRENPNPEMANEESKNNVSYNSPPSVQKSYENHTPGPQAVYDEHVLTKQEYLAQKRGKYNKTDFPNKPPRIFYYNGAEYYFNTYTGKDKQFMNYRCRDYNCNGSLKFHLKDSRMSPKILKDHYQLCKELKKPRTFSSTEAQRKFDIVVDSELEQSKDSIESASNIWERIARKAREFSALERKHIYPPDKKQFVKKVRLLRKSLNPKTADDKFVFADETGKSVAGENFIRFSNIFADSRGQKQHNILWASSSQANLMCKSKQIFIDSTYQSVPRYFYQLLTITAYSQETQANHPVGYCLMTSRSRDAYIQLLNYLKIQFSVYPHICIIDLDTHLKEAVNCVYPDCISLMCFYNLKRSLYFKLKTMGVMGSESTAEKIPSILNGINQALFRTNTNKDELLLQIDRMHREAGPEFDEFYESFKKFVEEHTDGLKYESVIKISNPLVEEMYNRLIQKCGPRPRLVAFIQKLREEENYYKMKYENLKEKASNNENQQNNIKEEVQDENYDFDQEPETAVKPRRKVFLIDEGQSEDDEIEDRYYSDKSSDYESDDFTDTKRNIELLKRVKLERLRRMERLECPNPADYKTEEEYNKAVKDYRSHSFSESYFDDQGNVYVRDRSRSTSDGKSFVGRKKGNRVFISTMCPNDERLEEIREFSREEQRRRGNKAYREIKLEDHDYSTCMTQVKYEDGENIYLGTDYDHTKGNSKIFEVRHEPKKPDPLQKFKDRILKRQQERAEAADEEMEQKDKEDSSKSKTKSKKETGTKLPRGNLMKSLMKKRDVKDSKSESKIEEKSKVKPKKKKEDDEEEEKEVKKPKEAKPAGKKFKFGGKEKEKEKDKSKDKTQKNIQGRSGEVKEEAKSEESSSSGEEEESESEESAESEESQSQNTKNDKKSATDKKKEKSASESESESEADKLKKKEKKGGQRQTTRSRSKSNTGSKAKKNKKESQASTTSTARNLRSKKKDELTPPNHEDKMPDNDMTRKLRKRKPLKLDESE